MFKATREIYNALTAEGKDGLKAFTEDGDSSSRVWLQFGLDNGSSYRIKFISCDDDNDVAVRVFSLLNVQSEKRGALLPVLNDLNTKYRYVKFCCDKDGDINVEYDYPVASIDPAASAREIVMRFANIISEAYPVLMHTLWS